MIITIEVIQTKHDPLIVDKILGRIYSLDGVEDVELLDVQEKMEKKDEPAGN
jgi:hypothetical protein